MAVLVGPRGVLRPVLTCAPGRGQVMRSLSFVVDNFDRLSGLVAETERLDAMLVALDRLTADAAPPPKPAPLGCYGAVGDSAEGAREAWGVRREAGGRRLVVEGLELRPPGEAAGAGRPLCRGLGFEVRAPPVSWSRPRGLADTLALSICRAP
jgi:hypothetical protein